jgi:hypothetical protein
MNKHKLNNNPAVIISVLFILLMFTGCSLIGGIFKMGVAIGIFLVVVLIIAIFILYNRFKKR